MKKISMILMAFALAITMSQCKKNEGQPTSNDEVVTITLDVKNNNTSKVVVNTATGTVDFETGDKIYVGSGGKYVGFLTHNGTNFSGNITNPTENQPLQFYFLGNVTPQETLSAGTTEECSVIISDQTEHLPVISCAASNENYVSDVTAYSAHLLNKCALVKFNVTTPSNSPICITGMKNKVTVDFTQNTMTPSMDGEGVIMLPAGSGENVEKWAILLPQETMGVGEIHSSYSGSYYGIRGAVPTITENGYLTNGVEVIVNTPIPIGSINGIFTINGNGDKVYFSQGNLQYQASTNTWRFAENQWDYVGSQKPDNHGNVGGTVVGSDNRYISSTYSGWIDLFGWGTSGYDHGANCYQPWSTSQNYEDYYAYGISTYNLFNQTGMADWGYNPISNGGDLQNQWRTLTRWEWLYVFNYRNTSSNIRYANGIVNGVSGVILLPDDWNNSIYALSYPNTHMPYTTNEITASDWGAMEASGAVFLPASGYRNGISFYNVGELGYYWSSSYRSNEYSSKLIFSSGLGPEPDSETNRYGGLNVRLVVPIEN